jgi:hypothetical protein
MLSKKADTIDIKRNGAEKLSLLKAVPLATFN